jgi:serine O-acetyltransferase
MSNKEVTAERLDKIAEKMQSTGDISTESRYIGLGDIVEDFIEHSLVALFPYHFGSSRGRFVPQEKRTWELMRAFDALTRALGFIMNDAEEAEETAVKVIDEYPELLRIIETDVRAGYEGDPAAKSADEIVLTYPAFRAISIYRIAHIMYEMKIEIIPRMMTEYAHKITGIDIHPGAKIGESFFIDHGTGVVIGETTTIGDHVKLYQHVTLGAKSFAVNPDGSLVKNIKRHPDIGNNVVIYSGTAVLGGDTKIGSNSVIGSNLWITRSVPSDTVVKTQAQADSY